MSQPYYPEYMTKSEAKAAAVKELKKTYRAGTRIPMTVTHVSRSGMSRAIKVMALKGGEIVDMSNTVALAMGHTINDTHDGVNIGGCGMDMCFKIAYDLSCMLHDKSRSKVRAERGRGYTLSYYSI